jgi:hypothetical protein
MLRRLVVVRFFRELEGGWRDRRNPNAVDATVEFCRRTFALDGVELHRRFVPVPIRAGAIAAEAGAGASATGVEFVFPARFRDAAAVARLRSQEWTRGVFSNPAMDTTDYYCGVYHVGVASTVATLLDVPALREAGLTGEGVRLAVVDTCVDGSRFKNFRGGWSPDPLYEPGSYRVAPEAWLRAKWNHGTMCALDAAIAAPDAEFLDYSMLIGMGRPGSEDAATDLGTAITAFGELVEEKKGDRRPLVVMCPWGLYDPADDTPLGTPENYSANANHPLNRKIADLVAAGADVVFAAGNCGEPCPDTRCGTQRGIHGANAHPDVITVAAVTTDKRRLGYSSQGPGSIDKNKPDIAAYSHFRGSGVYGIDTGTSAACGVAAGVCAALRQLPDAQMLSPEQMKAVLQSTALRNGSNSRDPQLGHGIIHAGAALKALKGTPR